LSGFVNTNSASHRLRQPRARRSTGVHLMPDGHFSVAIQNRFSYSLLGVVGHVSCIGVWRLACAS